MNYKTKTNSKNIKKIFVPDPVDYVRQSINSLHTLDSELNILPTKSFEIAANINEAKYILGTENTN